MKFKQLPVLLFCKILFRGIWSKTFQNSKKGSSSTALNGRGGKTILTTVSICTRENDTYLVL